MLLMAKVAARNARQEEMGLVVGRTDFLVAMLLNYVSRQEPSRMPSIHSLAASCNMSPSRLRHIIKQMTGVSFSRYIKTLRLRRARQLLQETFWSVKQVMLEVGMSDHSHFAKDYKKEFGESPTQTRYNAAAAGGEAAEPVDAFEPPNSHFGHKQVLATPTSNSSIKIPVTTPKQV